MKRYKFIIFSTILALFSTVACTDLEENVLDEQLGGNLVNNPSNAQALINPPYASLRRTIEWSNYWGLQEITTDEVIIPTRGTDWYDNGAWQQLHLHTWNSDHMRFQNVWNHLTQGVSRANTAINYISQFPQSTTNDLFITEARFLRAYYMYLINDLFGQVPFRAADETDYSASPEVLSRKEAADYIIDELKAILPNLKTKSEVGSTRATVGAAQTLLAKVYLNYEVYTGEAKWNDAISYCDQLISSSDYAVADDYWSMFQFDVAEHPEFILRVPMSDAVDYGGDVQWTNFALHYSQEFGNFNSIWNGPSTTSTFFNTWDTENDARFQDDGIKSVTGFNQGFLVGQQFAVDGSELFLRDNTTPLVFVPEIDIQSAPENAGIRVMKFAPDPNTVDQFRSPNDVPIMRISDVYLIRAEAKFRSDDEDGALADINYIRAKRNMDGKTLPLLTSLTLDDILDERGYELYWEGLRRQDLIRFGKFTNAYQEKEASEAFRTIFPVPTSAADVNENLDATLGNQ
ncbi:RagB/SusD family nutrient uptake outer membrane protein [Sunxiuqinia indica]|uniref:RagB/SusD family nutrient uptake outer membrane protein n=1 Tax=Sunxiuqinia indica TaxID=2692584 RepID=UPI00135C67E6|nr:RagB/SusD family nutrient uptake outer membrane protein [Sunxiuqinia indica]